MHQGHLLKLKVNLSKTVFYILLSTPNCLLRMDKKKTTFISPIMHKLAYNKDGSLFKMDLQNSLIKNIF